MAAQIGYYDTLKSGAGKVFTFLASITVTGTDGKTITCTQDTSLDEAVAMSSKAPKTDVIKGDGTTGRVLRLSQFRIGNGGAASTIKVKGINVWNGIAFESGNDIGKSGVDDYASLNADGSEITLINSTLAIPGGGIIVAVLSTVLDNNGSAVAVNICAKATAGGMGMVVTNPATGALLDWTTLVDSGYVYFLVALVTST